MQSSVVWILMAMAAYGGLHSLLASHAAKRLAYRLAGERACRFYRLFYNGVVTLTLVPVVALAALLPDSPLYEISAPWKYLALAAQGAAAFGLAVGVLQTGAMAFLGVRQALNPATVRGECPPGEPVHPALREQLVTRGLYRYMRHPLYSFGLLMLWLNPSMTWNLLALSTGITIYIVVGAYFEERKLLREYGDDYARYRARTPMLVPFLKWPGKTGE